MRFQRLKRVYELFSGLYGNYKRGILVLVAFSVLGAFLESFGVAMLIPLMSHILQQPLPDAGFITDLFASAFEFLEVSTHLRFILPLIAGIFILRAAVLFISEYIRSRITTDFERTTRRDLLRRLANADWSFLVKHRLGHAENTIMTDVGKCTKLLADISWTFLQFATVLIYAVIAISISPTVTLATIGAGAILILVSQPLVRRNRGFAAGIVTLNKSIAHDVNESVIGFKAIKAMGLGEVAVERIGVLFDTFRAIRIKQQVARSVITVSTQPVAVIFILSIFSYAFLQPDFSISAFAVVVFLIQRLFLYIERIQSALITINESLPNAATLLSFSGQLAEHHEKEQGSFHFKFENEIIFEQVHFSYKSGQEVLSNVHVHLHKGQTLAIVGPSGVGKTTIADLLLRLIAPTSGTITVDGVSLSNIRLSEWRKNIGYVAQDLFLLNDTIYNNVRFYDEHIDESDVQRALEDAALGDMVKMLPNGMYTNVGERGASLSAGQRQRIVLARILVRKPTLLILDEATSALDTESEQAILAAIRALRGKATVVIIAHRLSTVQEADVLLVLENGSVVESGSPKDLLDNPKSRFYNLHHIQEHSKDGRAKEGVSDDVL